MLLNFPSAEQQVVIRESINEDVETRDTYLQSIKNWLLNQPHLPKTWDDRCLINFLRGSEFSLETCKKKLDMYCTVRTAMPEFFANRDISRPEFEEIRDILDGAILPNLTPDGKRVTVAKASRIDFETPNMANLIKLVFMIGDLRLEFEKVGVFDVYVLDAGFPIVKHLLNVSPLILKKAFVCIQEAYPVIIKEVHIINISASIEFVLKVIKPFLNKKLRDSIHLHSNIETLYEFVPRDILPKEFGGTACKVKDLKAQWRNVMEERIPWFKEQENIKSDESKRVGGPMRYNGFFGFNGSFSQLSID